MIKTKRKPLQHINSKRNKTSISKWNIHGWEK